MPSPPRSKTEWKDEYTLLCERCGYIIEDLDQSLPCPECGKPIEESLSGIREGTPYQQNPSIKSTIETAWLTIRNPKQAIDQISFDQDPLATPIAHYLTYTIVACSAIFISWHLIFSLLTDLTSITNQFGIQMAINTVIGLGMITLAGFMIWTCFVVLTCVFTVVITVMMKLLRTRGDIDIAWVIAGHSSIGWAFTGLIWLCGLILYSLPSYLDPTNSALEMRIQMNNRIENILEPSFFLGIIIGSLIFIYISMLGIKQSRYLNLPRTKEGSDA